MAPALERQEHIRRFLATSDTGTLPSSYDYASCYPEVAGVLSGLASPYWQRMAGSGDGDDAFRFYRQVAANGLTSGIPRENSPLRNWIVQLRAEKYRQQGRKLGSRSPGSSPGGTRH
jgi:hypothetical protein